MIIVKRDGVLRTLPGAANIWIFTGRYPKKAGRITAVERSQQNHQHSRSEAQHRKSVDHRTIKLDWRLHGYRM
jgi:hypothetical protein